MKSIQQTPEIRKSPDKKTMGKSAARDLVDQIQNKLRKQQFFTVFLAGGSTPLPLYRSLAEQHNHLPWQRIHFFWSDERYVPPQHRDNNFASVKNRLFSSIDIPSANVHRVPTELPSPETTARIYDREVQEFFRRRSGKTRFQPDVILLGIGADGHTAGLHPDHPVLYENTRFITSTATEEQSISPPVITLTQSAISQGEQVWILASGSHKKQLVHTTLNQPEKARKKGFPVAQISAAGKLIWYVDESVC